MSAPDFHAERPHRLLGTSTTTLGTFEPTRVRPIRRLAAFPTFGASAVCAAFRSSVFEATIFKAPGIRSSVFEATILRPSGIGSAIVVAAVIESP